MHALLLTLFLLAAPAPAEVTIRLQPLGAVPADLVQDAQAALRTELGVRVEVLAAAPVPKAAWYPPRRRHRADIIIDGLAATYADQAATVKVLALTVGDISTTKGAHRDWGVFGLGHLGGRAAVVSSHRLRKGARNRAHLLRRFAHTVVHEAGHTLGLAHCLEPACLMQDAHGTITNTDSSEHLGPACRAQLGLPSR